MGKPSKRTPDRVARIVRAIEQGNGVRTASALAGIDQATLMRWQAENRDFRERIREARAKAEARLVRQVVVASRKNWRASTWMLERQNPEEWGQRVVLMVKEAFATALARLEKELDAPTFERVAGILAGLDGEGSVGASQGFGGDDPDAAQ